MLPAAHAILWFMAAFLLLWAASLLWRGIVRGAGGLRCPACRKAVSAPARTCEACGFSSERERDFRRARLHWGLIGTAAGTSVAAAVAAYLGVWVQSWSREEWLEGEGPGLGAWESAALGVAAFGLVLAVWSWRGDRSRGRKRCPNCWYDMSGGGLRCPECGHEAAAVKRLYRPRRRRFAAAVGVAVLLSSYGAWIVPRVRAGGWVAAVPTTVLIVGIPWWPDGWIEDPGSNNSEDWTLYGRWQDRAWDWQDEWLESRARSMALSRSSVRMLRRAALFIDLNDEPDVAARVQRAVIAGLIHESPSRRSETAKHFDDIVYWIPPSGPPAGIDASVVPGLLRGLMDPDRNVAACCATALGFGGTDAQSAVPLLIEMLGSRSPQTERMAAMFSLMRLACQSSGALEAVLAATYRDDPMVVWGAVFALRERGTCDTRITPRLLRLLDHPSDQVAFMAAAILARRGSDGPVAIPAILRQVDARADKRGMFVNAAYSTEWDADEFFPELLRLLSSESADVRSTAASVLAYRRWSVDVSAAVPQLERLLRDDADPEVARWASSALSRLRLDEGRRGPEMAR